MEYRLDNKKAAINGAKTRYRAQREILLTLGMSQDDQEFQVLHDRDCRAFVELMEEQTLGDSRRDPSWIWGDFSYIEKVSDGDVSRFLRESKCI